MFFRIRGRKLRFHTTSKNETVKYFEEIQSERSGPFTPTTMDDTTQNHFYCNFLHYTHDICEISEILHNTIITSPFFFSYRSETGCLYPSPSNSTKWKYLSPLFLPSSHPPLCPSVWVHEIKGTFHIVPSTTLSVFVSPKTGGGYTLRTPSIVCPTKTSLASYIDVSTRNIP